MNAIVVIVLGALTISVMCATVASAQSPHKVTLTTLSPVLIPFSAAMNFMSSAGYARYLSDLQPGRWKGSTL